jgi:hypothetical protein
MELLNELSSIAGHTGILAPLIQGVSTSDVLISKVELSSAGAK